MPEYSLAHPSNFIQIPETIVQDRKVSASDLGVYARLVHATTLFHNIDLNLMVNELKMPREETEAALYRLAAMGYLDPIEDSPEG